MRAMKRLVALVVLATTMQSSAAGQVQFYNGDFDYSAGVASGSDGDAIDAIMYENFTISGSGMYLTGIFGTFFSSGAWNSAEWEVRSGLTPGNGGTLLFSGTDAATRVFTGSIGGFSVYESGVSGLNLFLAPGEYWFGLSPLGMNQNGGAYLGTTSGLNGVNANLDGDAYFNSTFYSANFALDHHLNGNFSLGIEGRIAESTVPEPATMTLLATGLAGLAGARRRKRTNA